MVPTGAGDRREFSWRPADDRACQPCQSIQNEALTIPYSVGRKRFELLTPRPPVWCATKLRHRPCVVRDTTLPGQQVGLPNRASVPGEPLEKDCDRLVLVELMERLVVEAGKDLQFLVLAPKCGEELWA
jgi:hypothetical protein